MKGYRIGEGCAGQTLDSISLNGLGGLRLYPQIVEYAGKAWQVQTIYLIINIIFTDVKIKTLDTDLLVSVFKDSVQFMVQNSSNLFLGLQRLPSQHFIFFVTYKWAQ